MKIVLVLVISILLNYISLSYAESPYDFKKNKIIYEYQMQIYALDKTGAELIKKAYDNKFGFNWTKCTSRFQIEGTALLKDACIIQFGKNLDAELVYRIIQ